MFIINTISEENAQGEVKEVYEILKSTLGFLPPHTKLFATLDIEGLKEFVNFNIYLKNHPRIESELLLPFLRLYIAKQECRDYCSSFNTKLLLAKKIKKEIIKNITTNFNNIPIPKKQIVLAQTVLQALFSKIDKDDFQQLYNAGFHDQDFYDLLNYATQFTAKSKIIDIYLER